MISEGPLSFQAEHFSHSQFQPIRQLLINFMDD
jgi:hypothetical protein